MLRDAKKKSQKYKVKIKIKDFNQLFKEFIEKEQKCIIQNIRKLTF
jgi:hypothetical protein